MLNLVKDIWGEGATSKLPFGMHTSKPQTHEGEVFHLHSDCPKDSVILASAMTQSGVLGKEMMVYVDIENM